jgi:hypothetical protein
MGRLRRPGVGFVVWYGWVPAWRKCLLDGGLAVLGATPDGGLAPLAL